MHARTKAEARASRAKTKAPASRSKRKIQRAKASVYDAGKPAARSGGYYRVGVPYAIGGHTYTPRHDPSYRAEGKASWYGGSFHGRRTANGERFDMHALTAAHPTLPMPSHVRVTNLENHRSLVLRVNDRGPYRGDRLIDVSVRAAKLLGFHGEGLARVRVEYVARAELSGSGSGKLVATLHRDDASPQQGASANPTQAQPAAVEMLDARAGEIESIVSRRKIAHLFSTKSERRCLDIAHDHCMACEIR